MTKSHWIPAKKDIVRVQKSKGKLAPWTLGKKGEKRAPGPSCGKSASQTHCRDSGKGALQAQKGHLGRVGSHKWKEGGETGDQITSPLF